MRMGDPESIVVILFGSADKKQLLLLVTLCRLLLYD